MANARGVAEVQLLRSPDPGDGAEPGAGRDDGRLDPQRRPHHVLPGLGPGRYRRRGHRPDLGHEPDPRHHLHHPGVPRRRRRRCRPAEGHRDRGVGRRRASRRSSPTGPAAAWRRSSPSPSWSSSSSSVRRACSPSGRGGWHDGHGHGRPPRYATTSRRSPTLPATAPQAAIAVRPRPHVRPAARHRRPGAGPAGVGARLALRLPPRQPRQVLLLGARRGRHRPGLGSWRHARHGPGRLLRARRLRHGDAHEARGRRRRATCPTSWCCTATARCRRGGSRSAADPSPCSRSSPCRRSCRSSSATPSSSGG